MLIDTHAHLHHQGLACRIDEVLSNAAQAGVVNIINVGVNAADSAEAVQLANRFDQVYAAIGLHPHEANKLDQAKGPLAALASQGKVVAIGECGLDYVRSQTGRPEQAQALRFQIELALEHNLPMIWHVREAFSDFFSIIDQYPGLRGIVHSFTGSAATMQQAVERGYLIALNGIMTFSKDQVQLEAARATPLRALVLETDCPFLAPVPMRGGINEPSYLKYTAAFLAQLRAEAIEDLARESSRNAQNLFNIG